MPFVACLNYGKHSNQPKNPGAASRDIPPDPPPRPVSISTRQQLPIPQYGKAKSKLEKHVSKLQNKLQERQGEMIKYTLNGSQLAKMKKKRISFMSLP